MLSKLTRHKQDLLAGGGEGSAPAAGIYGVKVDTEEAV